MKRTLRDAAAAPLDRVGLLTRIVWSVLFGVLLAYTAMAYLASRKLEIQNQFNAHAAQHVQEAIANLE